MANAIEIHDVTKRFRLNKEKADSLKERVVKFHRMTHEDFWALKGIDIDVGQGETMGLLGHNGSGKSTLLKCVAGILRPTQGTIRSRGRMAALLELGAGFHPDLTGRENIFLNGSILGLHRTEIARIFDDIVEFAEIEPFIDNQVKHYSSGMHARLGFAVAVNVEPEILLVDEVLAVGDETFQRKCLDRIKQFQRDGRTMLIVTHVPDLARRICDRVAVLDHGNLVTVGPPGRSVLVFRDALREGQEARTAQLQEANGPTLVEEVFARPITITGARVVYPDASREYVLPGEPVDVVLDYSAVRPVSDVVFAINVHDRMGNLLLGSNTDFLNVDLGTVSGRGQVTFRFDAFPVLEGPCAVSLGIHTHDGGKEYDHRAEQEVIEVLNHGRQVGIVAFPVEAILSAHPKASEAGHH